MQARRGHACARKAATCAALLCVVATAARGVKAQDEAHAHAGVQARLVWERGEGAEACVSEEELSRSLEEHLGYRLFGDDGELLVQGRVAREASPPRFRAEVELRDREGHMLGKRAVEAPGNDCRALDEALVLVVALAVDVQMASLRAARVEAPPPVEAPEPPEPEAEPAPPPVVPEPTPVEAAEPVAHTSGTVRAVRVSRTGSTYGLVLAAGAGLGLGVMPKVAANAALTLGVRTPKAFSFELAAVIWPTGGVPTSEGDALFRAGYAELRACAPLWATQVTLDLCLGVWNGILRARGEGFSGGDFSFNAPLSGASAHVRAAYWIERLFVRASVGVGVPFLRDRFVVEHADGERVLLHRLDKSLALGALDVGVQLR